MTKPPETHSLDYKPGSWTDYTIEELGQFVHLLTKRAKHHTNSDEIAKDLYAAYSYLDMMRAKVQAVQSLLGISIRNLKMEK